MSQLKLNANNDLHFTSNGQLVLIEGVDSDEEILQRVRIRLKSFKGEWFVNSNYGLPYFDEILGSKNLDLNIVESILRSNIIAVKGIKELLESSIDYDADNRSILYTFNAATVNNTIITDNLTI
jgi:hypothetical protein